MSKRDCVIKGVVAVDQETGKEYRIKSSVVINATGIFSDQILKMDDPNARKIISVSQGVHIVLDKEFLPGESAIMVPQTEDGRVLFVVPWHGKVIVGTTDTPIKAVSLEPQPLAEEVEFILHHAAKYMSKDPAAGDVKSVFAGLRPLVNSRRVKETSSVSREHVVLVSQSGLITIAGGKWTTYRRMGEDAIDRAARVGGLRKEASRLANLKIHGWLRDAGMNHHGYGSDMIGIENLISHFPSLGERIHPALPYRKAEVVWHVRKEMARTVEDVLSRRTRALLLDANASIEAAPVVAGLMARELGRDERWMDDQVRAFGKLAKGYTLSR